MSVAQERDKLKSAFKSSKWADKVSKMSDAQVTAVYLRLKSQGKI